MSELYSLQEAADRLGRPLNTIKTMIQRGELPFVYEMKGSRRVRKIEAAALESRSIAIEDALSVWEERLG